MTSEFISPKLILLGNLNSISPAEESSENSFDQFDVRFDVINRLTEEGLVDVLDKSFKYVKPYKVFATQIYQEGVQTSDTKRVDYIYVSQFV